MRVGVLGPLHVSAGAAGVEVGGVRLRALLIRLALDAGNVVATQSLAEALWPDLPRTGPDHPAHALQSLVSRLRRALPDRSVVRSSATGYLLDIPAEDVDALRFERLAREGRQDLRDGRAASAAARLREALDLWRGEALTDVTDAPYAAAAAVRLHELRLGAIEDRIEAELTTGITSSVAELEELTAAHPLRERLRGLLIKALHAEGRQAEALAAYEEHRGHLAAELGTDPGPELRDLHLIVLRGERVDPPPRGNLRAPLTGLVGREVERRRIGARLRENRLVTLVGPGGVGKTRLATAVAADLPGPVWLVELAPATGSADVTHAVAAALGLRATGDIVTHIIEALSVDESVLVLDNCEHVIDAAARLAEELLGRCPGLRVLATSREPLNVTGEALCPVPPLEPDTAVRLFVDRAQAVQPGFVPTEAVAEVCRRLDGLPLAIELAAARLRSIPFDRLTAGLDDQFRTLAGGSRTALARHRTLRAVVEWSWDLLGEDEREAAEGLAVFPASLTSEAAEHVGVGPDALHALVDKSLLQPEDGRYRMLDTIRAYGVERLAEAGRLEAARAAHAACYLEIAERAEPHLRGAAQLPWITALTAERDHLAAALRFACESGDAETAVRLGAALGMFWIIHGDHAEGAERLRAALQVPGPGLSGPAPPDSRASAVAAYLLNAMFAGDLTEAKTIAGEDRGRGGATGAFVDAVFLLGTGEIAAGLAALDDHLADPDPWTRAMLWLARAFLHGADGDTYEGRRDLIAAAGGFREAGERWGLSLSLMSLAYAHASLGDPDDAITALDEAVGLVQVLGIHNDHRVWLAMIRIHAGDRKRARAELLEVIDDAPSTRHVASARLALADLARFDDDVAEAARQLALAGDSGDPAYRTLYLSGAGYLAVAEGDLSPAARDLSEALALAITMPDMPMIARVGVGVAQLLLRRGAPREAARVLGAAHTLRGGPDSVNPDVVRLARELHDHQDDYARGRALDREGALGLLRSSAAPPSRSSR